MKEKGTITFRQWLYLCWMGWIIGWAELLDGLIRILTFGFVYRGLAYRVIMRRIRTRSSWNIEGGIIPKVKGW